MIGKLLSSTQGKRCSCPTGKICMHCKKKKVVHPQVFVEGPRRLPAPITITYHKPEKKIYKHNATVQYFEKPKRWGFCKRQTHEPHLKPKPTSICRWYKRRKALKELIAEQEKENKLERKRYREHYERERIRDILDYEYKKRAKSLPPPSTKGIWENPRKESKLSLPPLHPPSPPPTPTAPPPPKKRLVYIKEKSANIKPRAQSKYVSAKKYTPRETLTKRFVNYCYRFCCQFYCYLTCVILITVAVIAMM